MSEQEQVVVKTEEKKVADKPKRDPKQPHEKHEKKEGGQKPRKEYVKKGEKKEEEKDNANNHKEENKEEKPKKEKREKKQRESKYDYDRSKVTLETPIPEVPKREKRISKPDDNEFEKKLEELETKIDNLNKQRRKFIDDVIHASKSNKDQSVNNNLSLRDVYKIKADERQLKRDVFEASRAKFNLVKNEIMDLFDKTQKLRQKMKKLMKKEEIEARLKELQNELQHGIISVQEEKKIIKEIEELEKALPFTHPLDALEVQIEKLQKEKKTISEEMNKAFNEYKTSEDEIQHLKTSMDQEKQSREENKSTTDSIINAKREEIQKEIEVIKEQKKKLKKEHSEAKTKFYDEQDLVRYAEWLKKVQSKIKQNENWKKRQEEKEKQKQVDENAAVSEDDENPYVDEIELCKMLVNYCEKLRPAKEQQKEEHNEDKEAELNKKLGQADWQREKVTLLKSKKDTEFDLYEGNKNKKNKRTGKQQPQQKKGEQEDQHPEKQPLNHQVEVHNYFDEIKVSAPLIVEDLDKTIKLLNEKREYFENAPKPTKEKKQEQKEEEKNKKEEQQKEKQDSEKSPEKSPKKSKKQTAIVPDFDDEKSFPTMK